MGIFGTGPFQCDDALDVIHEIEDLLGDAWAPFLPDDAAPPEPGQPIELEVDDEDIALADDAARIAAALARSGIEVRTGRRDELVELWGDDLPSPIHDALTMRTAPSRPGFPDERDVERWLREGGAPYELWVSAGRFGDDRLAAWRGLTGLEAQLTIARLVLHDDDAALTAAFAACLRDELVDHQGTWVTPARTVAARLATREPVAPALVDELISLEKRLIAERYQRGRMHDAARTAVAAAAAAAAAVAATLGPADQAAPPPAPPSGPPRDPALSLVRSCQRLATGGASRALGGVSALEADLPALGLRLKTHLDPLVAPALARTR